MPILRFGLILLIIGCYSQALAKDEYAQVPCAIQISSQASDGKYALSDIVRIARENGMKAVVITERDLMRWEYGLWPLRNVIKKRVEDKSLFKYGIKRYLDDFQRLESDNPDMVLIPGIESAPLYHWSGNTFKANFQLLDWHKHLLVIGLDKYADIRKLPVIGNSLGLALPFGIKNILLIWPLGLIIIGIILLVKRKFNYRDSLGRQLGQYSRIWQIIGLGFLFIGTVFSINNYPYRFYQFDQYSNGMSVFPYQNFIDYVTNRGALVYWSHPDAQNTDKTSNVLVATDEHSQLLLRTIDYTGFAVFFEGFRKTGIVQGVWDHVLTEYCQGLRKRAVFAIGGLSYDKNGDLAFLMRDMQNILLVNKIDKENVLEAMAKGRMYVVLGGAKTKFNLERFTISQEQGQRSVTMGEEIELASTPHIEIKGSIGSNHQEELQLKFIRNSEVIKTINTVSPFDISFTDENINSGQKYYYRAEIKAKGLTLITNPIFIKVKG